MSTHQASSGSKDPANQKYFISDRASKPNSRTPSVTDPIKIVDNQSPSPEDEHGEDTEPRISDYLREAFEKDSTVISYLNQMAKTTQSPNPGESSTDRDRSSSRPPLYQKPKSSRREYSVHEEIPEEKAEEEKDDTMLNNNTELFRTVPTETTFQKDQSAESEEEPIAQAPIPNTKPKFELDKKKLRVASENKTQPSSKRKSVSPSNPIRAALSKSVPKMVQPLTSSSRKSRLEDDETYRSLRRFYQGVLEEKKSFQKAKDRSKQKEIEESLFQKENTTPNIIKELPEEVSNTRRSTGRIRKQHTDRVLGSLDYDMYPLNMKYHSRASIFSINPSELQDAEKLAARDFRREITSIAKDLYNTPSFAIPDHVNQNFDIRTNHQILPTLLSVNRIQAYQIISFAQKFSYLGLIKYIIPKKLS